ncbi:hypothetical protein GGX14DRAFT_556032 [Mycena pura]|uniref:Protein kinase domain-containing protein n=1 Tax=Mycena pura TaxID=153505 RepID=A0AAD6YSC9_9AGAR|nr:hypothetical protein GGX14DRAFT_556032 [Mycena pura]
MQGSFEELWQSTPITELVPSARPIALRSGCAAAERVSGCDCNLEGDYTVKTAARICSFAFQAMMSADRPSNATTATACAPTGAPPLAQMQPPAPPIAQAPALSQNPPLAATLRRWLPPHRIIMSAVGVGRTTTAKFAPISDRQMTAAKTTLRDKLPKRWSIHERMAAHIIEVAARDLDKLMSRDPTLKNDLESRVNELEAHWAQLQWAGHILGEMETRAIASTDLLCTFVKDAIACLQKAALRAAGRNPPAGVSPGVQVSMQCGDTMTSTLILDKGLHLPINHKCLAAIDNKRPSGLPGAVYELAKRGRSCGVVDIQLQEPLPNKQRDWWVLANKGALFVTAYETTWMIWASNTAYCVGHRCGDHLFWSILYNRRDAEDEVYPHTVKNVRQVFTGEKDDSSEDSNADMVSDAEADEDMDRPEGRQDGILLLFLGIALLDYASWFPDLYFYATTFELELDGISNVEPRTHEFDKHGDDPGSDFSDSGPADDSQKSGGKSGRDSSVETRSKATTLSCAGSNFQGRWFGELATARGFSVEVIEGLSHNDRNSVYRGTLLENDVLVSPVAVKVSDQTDAIVAEFEHYMDLKDHMEGCIPKCYGLCVSSGGSAFLVTGLVQELDIDRSLTLADRNAIYAVLDKMHRGGWRHDDVIGHTTVRNVLWSHTGRPILIDLESATKHVCKKDCRELRQLRKILKLPRDASRKGSKRKRLSAAP